MSVSDVKPTARKLLPAKLAPLGPWALVTGASDGIGAATARELAAKGFGVILVARRQARLEALAAELGRDHGAPARCITADLSEDTGVDMIMASLQTHGIDIKDIDVAVLAAGYGTTGALAEVDIETERNLLRVNCDAVLHLAHIFAKSMAARGAGQIVLFGSIVGFQGNAMTANYAATKAYVQSLAEGLAVELRPSGVHVLSVAPGPIASGFAGRAGMTMGQAGTPEEVGRGIVRNLGRSGTIRPGLLSKVLGYNMAMTPRPLRVRIMSGIMAGMANGKEAKRPATQEA